jgi:hypothetical protein
MAYDKPPSDPVILSHKDFGAAYFEANLPNSYERMWMVARAINFDFDNYNKLYSTPDIATKKRYVKNAFRFFDSPLNYIYWHSIRYFQNGTFRFLPIYWGICFGSAWWFMGSTQYKASVGIQLEKVFKGKARTETPVEHFTFNKNLTLFFHEHEFMMDKGLVSQKSVTPQAKYVRLNNFVRDQNFRKYFAHRERRGADPFTGKPLA